MKKTTCALLTIGFTHAHRTRLSSPDLCRVGSSEKFESSESSYGPVASPCSQELPIVSRDLLNIGARVT